MIRNEYYEVLAETFECSIGVATVIGPASADRRGNGRWKGDDVLVNRIIAKEIISGDYPQFRRKVLKAERGRDRRVKESTFYKSLIDGVKSE